MRLPRTCNGTALGLGSLVAGPGRRIVWVALLAGLAAFLVDVYLN